LNRVEFLKELEELLQDIPTEERMEALTFYDSYFEEAGELNEPIILRELGSPAKVAKSIKLDLGTIKEEESGEYTERGYQDSAQSKDSIMKLNEVSNLELGDEQQDYKENRQSNSYQNQGNQNQSAYNENQNFTNQNQNSSYQNQNTGYQNNNQNYQNQNSGYQNQNGNYQNQNAGYQYQNGNYQNQNTSHQNQNMYYQNGTYQNQRPIVKKTGINVFALILLCIFGFPIIIPLMIACFATVFGLVVGFGGAGIGCIIAGFALFVTGVAQVFVIPMLGALAVGGGLLCFGIGLLLFLVACYCAKMFPVLIRGLVGLLKAPFGGRSVVA